MVHLLIQELQKYFPKNIPRDHIFNNTLVEEEYFNPPYGTIVAQSATISEKWSNPILVEQKKIQEKFTITQPFHIEFVYGDIASLSEGINEFLSKVPRYIILKDQAINLRPQNTSYPTSKGSLDLYNTTITLITTYSIYGEPQDIPRIKSIDMNVFPSKGEYHGA